MFEHIDLFRFEVADIFPTSCVQSLTLFDICFSVAKANVDVVKPSDFVVELNYYEYQNEKGDSVALSLATSSPYVENVSYSPRKVKKVKESKGFGQGFWNLIF